jgi:predicted nuclease of restriction endonuclease-like RecB superfamily
VIATDIRLFDARDTPWIATLLDIVERSLGEPWRILAARVEEAALAPHPSRVDTILGALRRIAGGGAERARIARRVRALVLGHPALDRDARDARLSAAACSLGLAPADVESLLWADIARERPVTFPKSGRPAATTLAAYANLDRIQRALRRAREVRIRIADAGQDLVRAIARRGLIAEISRDGDSTVFDITGPLALFHSTTVYGRTLASLVPLLADHASFAVDVTCDFDGQQRRLHVESPVSLPPPFIHPRRRPSFAERLAVMLVARGHTVERDPDPIVHGSQLLFPELRVDGTYVELVGFATAEYLAARRAAYAAAGIDRVRLCIARSRMPAGATDVVAYTTITELGDAFDTGDHA